MRNDLKSWDAKYNMLSKVAGAGIILSFVPIWRSANAPGLALNFWEYLIYSQRLANGYPDTHIPYEEAVEKARTAWRSRGR